MYLAAFRYGAHDKEKEPGHAEMLAYVQTSKDLVRSLSAVDTAKTRVAAGQPVITVAGEATWPLTWYLRDVNAQWASRIDQATTPIIVADWDPEGGLEKQLAPKYDAKRVPIRAWWFPGADEGRQRLASDPARRSALVALPRDLEPDRLAGRDLLRAQGPRRHGAPRAPAAPGPGHVLARLPPRRRARFPARLGRRRPRPGAVRRAARPRGRRAAATSTWPTRRTAASRSSTATAPSCARSGTRARGKAS